MDTTPKCAHSQKALAGDVPSMHLLEGCFFFPHSLSLFFDFTGYAARSSKAHFLLGRELNFSFLRLRVRTKKAYLTLHTYIRVTNRTPTPAPSHPIPSHPIISETINVSFAAFRICSLCGQAVLFFFGVFFAKPPPHLFQLSAPMAGSDSIPCTDTIQ